MIGAPAIGQRNCPGSAGSDGTPVLRFGPWAGLMGITSMMGGVSGGPRISLKPSKVLTLTPYALARLAGVSPFLTTTTTPGSGASLMGRPTVRGNFRPGFDQTMYLHGRLYFWPMLSSVSPSTTMCTIGARLTSGVVGMEIALLMTLSRPSDTSPTAPS